MGIRVDHPPHHRREVRVKRGAKVVHDERPYGRGGPPRGPGDALHAALEARGYEIAPGCACRSKIAAMNRHGIDWCLAHIDKITGWLHEEAKRRRMLWPTSFLVGRWVAAVLKRYARSLP